MKISKSLLILSIFFFVSVDGARGQWNIVCPNLYQNAGQVLYVKNGVVWAGGNGVNPLHFSVDTGKTWLNSPLDRQVLDINFFDSKTGVCGADEGVYLTTNGGQSWNRIFSLVPITNVAFGSSDSVIYASYIGEDNFFVTTDMGLTWKSKSFGGSDAQSFSIGKDGTIYVFSCYSPSAFGPCKGWINSSTDAGKTWSSNTGSVIGDSFGLIADSCDKRRLYLASENYLIVDDSFSRIFVSSDAGASWDVSFIAPLGVIGGNISSTPQVIYAGTMGVPDSFSVNHIGILRSLDQGQTWKSIGGPGIRYDTRNLLAFNNNIVFAIDRYGNVCATYNSGGDSVTSPEISSFNTTLFIPSESSILNQSLCSTQVDTSIPLAILGCGTPSGTLDSLWITGSPTIQIVDTRTAPRTFAALDSILVRYSDSHGPDTSSLHIRYSLGSGLLDTSITLIGFLTNTQLSVPVRLHREVGESYFGSLDSLPLGVDINPSVNLDSIWPYLHDISGTYSFDSSVVTYAAYWPPSGWSVSSITNNGNAVDFRIHNLSSKSPSQPMYLGIAEFFPTYAKLLTSDVTLTNFILDVGNQSIAPCVTTEEDQHWSVKVLVTDGVAASGDAVETNSLSIYPNPAGDEVFVQNPNASAVLFTIYDAIGRAVVTGSVLPSSTSSFNIQSLAQGVYFLRASNDDSVQTGKRLVIMR